MSENERAERCETCRYWNCYKTAMWCIVNDVNESDEVGGECRRMPPLYHRHDVGKWALTNQSDWCGEWQPIGPSEAPSPSGIDKTAHAVWQLHNMGFHINEIAGKLKTSPDCKPVSRERVRQIIGRIGRILSNDPDLRHVGSETE